MALDCCGFWCCWLAAEVGRPRAGEKLWRPVLQEMLDREHHGGHGPRGHGQPGAGHSTRSPAGAAQATKPEHFLVQTGFAAVPLHVGRASTRPLLLCCGHPVPAHRREQSVRECVWHPVHFLGGLLT